APRGPAGCPAPRLRRLRHLRRVPRLEMAARRLGAPARARLGILGGELGPDLPPHPARDSLAPSRRRGRLSGRLSQSLRGPAPLSARTHAAGPMGARGDPAGAQSHRLRRPAQEIPAPADAAARPETELT